MTKLKNSLTGIINHPPEERLKEWINKRNKHIPEFKIRKVTQEEFRKYIQKSKGSKSSGTDEIDSYSIKISAPIIEDVLIHLINLTIENNGNHN